MSALGTIGISSLKGVAIAVLLGGIIGGTPIAVFLGGDKRTGIQRAHDTWSSKNLLKSGFTLGKEKGNTDFGISFKNTVNFDLKQGMRGSTKNFQDVTMVFDDYVLNSKDLLVSPEQNGIYYLAKWDKGNQYKLQNGQTVQRFNRADANWAENKHIELALKTQHGHSMSKIVLETCTFTQKSDNNEANWKIWMTCYSTTRPRLPGEPQITAILSKENFNEVFGRNS